MNENRENNTETLSAEIPENVQLQQKILEIERSWWKIASTRADAIMKVLGFSESRYYLILGTLLDSYDFWKLDPPLVGRLKTLRDGKLKERQGCVEDEK